MNEKIDSATVSKKGYSDITSEKRKHSNERLIEVGLELFDGDESKLYQAIYNASKMEKTKAKLADAKYNTNTVKVFDIEKLIHIRDNLSSNERSLRTILKKFNLDSDTGYRELKGISQTFTTDIENLKQKYPNCREFLEFIDEFAALSLYRSGYREMSFPPVLLSGPPGVGKTAVVSEVAKLLEVTCRKIDFATVTSGFVLSGSTTSWSEAKTGCVIDILRDGLTANSILILDEIDKVGGDNRYDPLGSLYTLLEKNMAAEFIDEALDLPVNASHLMFVATANNVELIPDAIRSRFIEISIKQIEKKHHKVVTQSIYVSHLKTEKIEEVFSKKINDETLWSLRGTSPREIKLILARAVAKAARRSIGENTIQLQPEDLILAEDDQNNPVGFIWNR